MGSNRREHNEILARVTPNLSRARTTLGASWGEGISEMMTERWIVEWGAEARSRKLDARTALHGRTGSRDMAGTPGRLHRGSEAVRGVAHVVATGSLSLDERLPPCRRLEGCPEVVGLPPDLAVANSD
jgi:hypothetical protein